MKPRNNLVSKIVLPILIVLFGLGLYYLIENISFIPMVKNILIIISIISLLGGSLLALYNLFKSDAKGQVKIIGSFAIYGLSFYLFFIPVFGMFGLGFKGFKEFEYQGKKYYIQDDGFVDRDYVISEQDGMLTMKQIHNYMDLDLDTKNYTEEMKASLVDGTYRK